MNESSTSAATAAIAAAAAALLSDASGLWVWTVWFFFFTAAAQWSLHRTGTDSAARSDTIDEGLFFCFFLFSAVWLEVKKKLWLYNVFYSKKAPLVGLCPACRADYRLLLLLKETLTLLQPISSTADGNMTTSWVLKRWLRFFKAGFNEVLMHSWSFTYSRFHWRRGNSYKTSNCSRKMSFNHEKCPCQFRRNVFLTAFSDWKLKLFSFSWQNMEVSGPPLTWSVNLFVLLHDFGVLMGWHLAFLVFIHYVSDV